LEGSAASTWRRVDSAAREWGESVLLGCILSWTTDVLSLLLTE
jgi:hypothetical protein